MHEIQSVGPFMDVENISSIDRDMEQTSSPFSYNYSTTMAILVLLLLTILTLWILFGNGLVLLVLIMDTKIRSISNILIGNLSASDFLLSLTVIPLSISSDILGYWLWGEGVCIVWLSMDVLYCTASIWGLVAIAFDRFTATMYPLWYRASHSKSRAFIYCGLVWFLSIAIVIPGFYHMVKEHSSNYNTSVVRKTVYFYSVEKNEYECRLYDEQVYVVYSSMGSFLVPLIVMLLLYMKIFCLMHQHANMMHTKHISTYIDTDDVVFQPQSTLSRQSTLFCCSPILMYFRQSHRPSSIRATDSSHAIKYNDNELTKDISLMTESSLYFKQSSSESQHSCHPSIGIHLQVPSLKPASGGVCSADEITSAPFLNERTELSTIAVSPYSVKGRSSQVVRRSSSTRRRSTLGLLFRRRTESLSRAEVLEMRATKRMALIMVVFILCWIPFTVMYIYRAFTQRPIDYHIQALIIWLGYANSAINPILYTIFSQEFRKAFEDVLKRTLCGRVCTRIRGSPSNRFRRSLAPTRMVSVTIEAID